MSEELYSTAGPQCPYCGHVEQPSEPCHYDERSDRLDCEHCGREYAVSIFTLTSWTTSALPYGEQADAQGDPA